MSIKRKFWRIVEPPLWWAYDLVPGRWLRLSRVLHGLWVKAWNGRFH